MRASRWHWLLALMAAVPAMTAQADPGDDEARTRELAGDYLQVGLPLAALALTFLADEAESDSAQFVGAPGSDLDIEWPRMNGSPRHDLALAIARTEITTYGLKYGVNEQRPNGGGQSFPSGHTSIAFSGAEFIRKQYGWKLGAPAYLAAGFVGWSRVESGAHWTHDVLAGAAIGILSNHDDLGFDIPIGRGGYGRLSLTPTLLATPSFLSLDPLDPADAQAQSPEVLAPGLHFAFRF